MKLISQAELKRVNSKKKIPHPYIRISVFVRLQLGISSTFCLTNKNEFCYSNLELVREASGPSYRENVFRAELGIYASQISLY